MNTTDQLLEVLTLGVPAKVTVQLDFQLNTAAQEHGSAESTHALHYKLDDIVAKLDKTKSLLVIAETDNKHLRKELKKVKTKLSDLNVMQEEPQRGRGIRLTQEVVWRIRRLVKIGRSDTWIANALNLSSTVINRIRHNKSYKHIPIEPANKKPLVIHPGYGEVGK